MPKNNSKYIGHHFLYKMQTHFVKDVRVKEDGTHVIETDKGTLKLTSKQLIDEFLPIEDEPVAPTMMIQLSGNDASDIRELTGIVLDSIRKVRTEPSYVDQAKIVNQGAQVVVNIKRLILEAVKVSRELK